MWNTGEEKKEKQMVSRPNESTEIAAAAVAVAEDDEAATAAVERLRACLNPDEISDIQAVRSYLVRQFNILMYERAQHAKRQQAHGEWVRKVQEEIAALNTISGTAMRDWANHHN